MPTAKEAMYAALSTDAGVTAVVGQQIYPDQASEKAVEPWLIFAVESDVRFPVLRPSTTTPRKVIFNLVGQCQTRAQSQTLETALEALLDGKALAWLGGLQVKSSVFDPDSGAEDEDEALRPGEEFGLRTVSIRVFWFV